MLKWLDLFGLALGPRGKAIVFQGLLLFFRFGQQVLLVPLFLQNWGTEGYRDWLILVAVVSLARFVDLGLPTYLGNRLLQLHSRGDQEGFNRALKEGFSCLLVDVIVSSAILSTAIILLPWQIWAGASGQLLTLAALFLLLEMLLRVLLSLAAAVHLAHGRIDRFLYLSLVDAFIILVGPAAALALRVPISVVAMIQAASAATMIVICFVSLRRHYGKLQYMFALPSCATIIHMLKTSVFYLFLPSVQTLKLQGLLILLTYMGWSSTLIVLLATTRTIVNLSKTVINQITIVLSNSISKSFAANDAVRFRALFFEGERFVGGATGVLLAFILWIGPAALQHLTLHKVGYSPPLFWSLVISALLCAPAELSDQFLFFTNQPRRLIAVWLIEAMTLLVLVAVLGYYFNIEGLCVAIIGSEYLVRGIWSPIAARHDGAPEVSAQLREVYWPLFLGAGISGAAGWAIHWIVESQSVTDLVLISVLWGCIMVPIAPFILLSLKQRQQLFLRLHLLILKPMSRKR